MTLVRDETSAVKIAYVTTVALSVRLLFLNQLRDLQRCGFNVTAISAGGDDLDAIRAAGIRHLAVPFTRRMSPLADLLVTWRLWRLFRRERFTIVHTHQPKPGLFAQIAARLAGVPIVVNTVHGFLFTDRSPAAVRRLWVTTERIASSCSDRLLCVSAEDAVTSVRERISPPERVVAIGGGIDIQRFSRAAVSAGRVADLRREFGVEPGQLVIGFVGRLVREKGIPELLDAFRLVRQQCPKAILLFVGPTDPDKRDAIRPEAMLASDVGHALRFAGYRHDMPDLYALMDVFALPSHREGLPQTLMEAAAMELPAVTTDVRGCREVTVHGETGFVVPHRDVAALSSTLLRLLQDAELRACIGRRARARALALYDERALSERLQDVYASLLGVRRSVDVA